AAIARMATGRQTNASISNAVGDRHYNRKKLSFFLLDVPYKVPTNDFNFKAIKSEVVFTPRPGIFEAP
ncbi:MAG: hypothetical protein IJ730_01130, partial [Alphaproteobacteria bacterium]|nr:hypothetical protein [Alphaproteobacteria bacterium]